MYTYDFLSHLSIIYRYSALISKFFSNQYVFQKTKTLLYINHI